MEKIEERTVFSIPFGELNVFETNVICHDFPFFFEEPVITLMLSGNKIIRSDDETFEFKERSVFIPPCNKELSIDIHPIFKEPTKCLVLNIEQEYIDSVFSEVIENWHPDWDRTGIMMKENTVKKFISSDESLWRSLTNLYNRRIDGNLHNTSDFLLSLSLKELIYELMKTNAKHILLHSGKAENIQNGLQEVVHFIKNNYREPITIRRLAALAGMSEANLFKKFKHSYSCTPVEYIIQLRIEHAKQLLISNPEIGIKNICFESGFNTLEYFYRKFTQITGKSPKKFKVD
ncbi:helix-turn-helix domain-containing protein [Chryseobacterium sp. 2VB]|uniref:helix-turn-helix domain-containing protein n=1 Tax=Chryseobacterium sp. 2VB TaxID=2502204 RepID=UPI0010F7C37B|nr:helix-turn-helix domain-containing protein [Chryseobacterium sp. 2VB]